MPSGELDDDSVSRDTAATDAVRASRPVHAEILFGQGGGYARPAGQVSYTHLDVVNS